MNKKYKTQERKFKLINNQLHYNKLIAETMTMQPLFLENFEELNEVLPEFFTTDLLKKLEMFSNSLYYKQSDEDLAGVADEQIQNTKELREFFNKSFEL
jgi:hypothetical protein